MSNNQVKKLWFLQVGMNFAGMFAENNPPELFWGTETEANDAAWELAVEESLSWEGYHGIPIFTEDEDELEKNSDKYYAHEDERAEYVDYLCIEVNKYNWELMCQNHGLKRISWVNKFTKELADLGIIINK